MLKRLILILLTYAAFLCIFVAQKPLFMLCNYSIYGDVASADWWRVAWHGLPLDLSLAGYLTALPALLATVSVWGEVRLSARLLRVYFVAVSILLAVVAVADAVLYSYWGFRLDTTPLFYLATSPADAMASAPWHLCFVGIVAIAVYACLVWLALRPVSRSMGGCKPISGLRSRLSATAIMAIATGLLFIPIRGGFTVSTMNVGKVYFSHEQRLNHAAINPLFSLMESASKEQHFDRLYRFMPADQASRIFATMVDSRVEEASIAQRADADSCLMPLLANSRPSNVMIIILESFSSHLMTALGGEPNVAVRLDAIAEEGVLFTNFYANSFRTDRGLLAILSGYPAQPTTSLMKYPRKTQSLPSIAGSLRNAGYRTEYYYGGDADFTNMRSYLISSGFDTIIADTDFPVADRLSKWGVHDHLLFNRLHADMAKSAMRQPTLRVVQTSSSHEPFEVPYRRLDNDRLNAFAYTDSVVGDFVDRLKESPLWHDTLLLLVADHQGCYPEHIDNLTLERYRIPLVATGGALAEAPRRIATFGAQQDIAATLLSAMNLPHEQFRFSKDMLDGASPHFAFFTVPDAFGVVAMEGSVIFDCQGSRVALEEPTDGNAADSLLNCGKAYLQTVYDDIAHR